MPNIESDLLLLTLNLSQLKNKTLIVNLFVEGITALFPKYWLKWYAENNQLSEGVFRVCTREKTYGFIETDESIEGDSNVFPHFQNALQLLAIILERLEQNELLHNKKNHLQQLVDQQTSELIHHHEELNEANEELSISNEELIETNRSLFETNKILSDEINLRKKIEKKLRESDKFFNHATDMFCIAGFDGFFKVLNPTWENVLGWTSKELLAKPWIDFVHPDDANATENIKVNIVEGQEVYNFVNRFVCKNGDYKWLSWNSYPYNEENVMYGVARDITQIKENTQKLKAAQSEAKESAELLETLFDVIPDIIGVLDAEYRMQRLNKAGHTFFGTTPENCFNKRCFELIGKNKLCEPCAPSIALATKKMAQIEKYMPDLDQWFEVRAFPIFKDGEVSLIVEYLKDITAVKKSEILLKKSEEQYRTLIEFAPDAFFQGDGDGHFIKTNLKASELSGYTVDELKSMSMLQLFSPSELDINPLQYDRISKGDTVINIRNLISKEGKTLLVEMCSRMLPDKTLQSFVRDITERHEKDQQLRTLTLAIDQSPNSVVITNIDYDIEYINPAIKRLTGYSKEELIGQNLSIFASDKTPKVEYEGLWSTIASGKVWQGELQNKKKNGELFWESTTISPVFDSQGEVTHYLAIKEDITQQKIMTRELIVAKEKAEESDRLKTSFLANMSHEIRTPMNSILGFASLLPEEENKELMRQYASIIVRNSEQLARIIDDIVLYSRLQTRLLRNIPTDFSACNLIDDVKQSFNLPEYYDKGIELLIENQIGRVCQVRTDYEKLRQILTNLVSNAFKYTNSGSITLGLINKNGRLIFYVKDTGIGIPKNETTKVFERFYRGENVTKSNIGGTGLGLSIVKEMVELLGGEIWIESVQGEGSTFWFTIA